MVPCFMCDVVLSPEELFKHIKNEHRDIEEYICMLCCGSFSRFSVYKKHVRSCKIPEERRAHLVEPDLHALFVDRYRNDEIENFKDVMNKSALELACKHSANMNFPRNATFEIIADFKKYIEAVTQGLKSIIRPLVEIEDKFIVDQLASAIESSLHDVRSECVLDSVLSKLDLIQTLKPSEIITEEAQPEENEPAEDGDKGGDEGGDERVDEEKREEERPLPEIKIATITTMPIAFQFKKFFELQNVYGKMKAYMEKVQESGTLCNFINGTLWKDKLKEYSETDIVIPYHIYFDQAQLNNALGSHCRLGQEMLGYYEFPCIPPEYASRLENIFPAVLHPGHFNKTYGNEQCYNTLIDELNTLAHEGILLNIDGVEEQVYFLLGLMEGDNLEINSVLDLVRSFRSHSHCRFCKLRRIEMEKAISEDPSKLRNRGNYETDVLTNNYKETGVMKESYFNRVASFHVTTSCAVDLTHDIAEGMQQYEIAEIILYFIKDINVPLTLNILNDRMSKFNYGDVEKGNTPPRIDMNHLKNRKFKMTASEMMCFARHLGLLIGDLVPEDDPVWQFYLITMEFVDLCFLPSYTEDDLGRLENITAKKNQLFITLFNKTLKPKHHYSTHYSNLIRKYGPLRYLKTIRLEGKHRIAKNYTKNTNSRVNISHSLGRKLQYNFASRILNGEGLDDKIVMGRNKLILFSDEKFNKTIEPSHHLNILIPRECYSTESITVNGILFSTRLFLPFVKQPNINQPYNNHILEICKIRTLSKTDVSSIYFICKKYNQVNLDQHFGCYSVKNIAEEKMVIINANEFLIEHKYPVYLHQIGTKYMFKCKHF